MFADVRALIHDAIVPGCILKESTLYSELNEDTIFSEQHQQLSLEGAEQSIVLLQNSAEQNSAAHLPLKRGLKVAVVGPNGDSSDVYFGEYSGPSCPEQPLNPGYFGCLPTGFDTIAAANTGGATTFASGCGTLDSDGNVLQPRLQQAHAFQQQACTHLVNMSFFNQTVRNADVIIIFVGQDVHVTEEEGKDRQVPFSPAPPCRTEITHNDWNSTRTCIVWFARRFWWSV